MVKIKLTREVQNRFKRLCFGLNFLGDLARGAEAPLPRLVAPLLYGSAILEIFCPFLPNK